MKKIILFFLFISLTLACRQGTSTNELPKDDLPALKKIKKHKRKELIQLQLQLEKLDSLIEILDPTSRSINYKNVTVDTLRQQNFDRFIDIQANIISDQEILVSAESGGRIVRLYTQEGQFIRRGALVAKLNMESLRKQRAEIETALNLAREVFEKQERLWNKQIGSEIQFLQAKNAKERLEKSLVTIDYQLSKANIYAPISGIVEQIFVKKGEVAAPGIPILKILNTHRLKISADVPENYIRSISKGDKVYIHIPVLDLKKELKVSRVGSSINPANRTFAVEVNILNKSGLLKPNMLALMKIKEKTIPDALVIPAKLIHQEINGDRFIFTARLQDDNYVAIKKSVIVEEYYNDVAVISSGVEPGDLLIVDGAQQISENNYLKIINN